MNENQIEELISCGIDYRGGVDRFGGNTMMYEKFIFRYLDDSNYSQLVREIENEVCDAGFRTAHTLKGVVGNLSFNEYMAVLEPVTEALRAGDAEMARSLFPPVEQAHEKVAAVLAKYR